MQLDTCSVCRSWEWYCNAPINLKLQYPPSSFPLGKRQAFDHCPWLGGGKFEPCAAGVGDFNQKRQVFSMKHTFTQWHSHIHTVFTAHVPFSYLLTDCFIDSILTLFAFSSCTLYIFFIFLCAVLSYRQVFFFRLAQVTMVCHCKP